MEANAIRITAEVQLHDPASCRFVVDRPVLPNGFARFSSAEKARGSLLAERLFALPSVTEVEISDRTVTVTKSGTESWRSVGPSIGAAIRAHLQSGQPAVSAEVLEQASAEDQMRAKVQRFLEEEVNPAIAAHGGYISLIDVRGNTVYICMGGGCQGCGQANVTLRQGIEQAIRQRIPEVGDILDVTDHAAGTNPYYRS
jgi:Fe-S cluster biogenesis protein NfuA